MDTRNEHGDLVRIDQTNVQDVLLQLRNRQDPKSQREAVEIVKAARERGELGQVFRLTEDGQDLEAFCDANDHDVSTAAALTEMQPRDLARYLIGVPRNSVQWRLAELPVVLSALLLESAVELVDITVAHEEALDGFVGDGDDDDDEGVTSSDDDAPEDEASDETMPVRLTAFLEKLHEIFGEVFEPMSGIQTMDPIRSDRNEACDIDLDAFVSNFGQLLDSKIVQDDRLRHLTEEDVEKWVLFLVGEKTEPELVVDERPAKEVLTENPFDV